MEALSSVVACWFAVGILTTGGGGCRQSCHEVKPEPVGSNRRERKVVLRDATVFCLVLVTCSLRLSAQAPTGETKAKAYKLIVNHDQQALFVPAWVIAEDRNLGGDAIVKMIQATVDAHADAQVDMLVQCVFAQFSTGMPNCRSAETWRPTPNLFPRPATDFVWNGVEKLGERDRIRIALKQCHDLGFDIKT